MKSSTTMCIILISSCVITRNYVSVRTCPSEGDMVLIPVGPFAMRNCMDPNEGNLDELPVHTVMVSAFYVDATKVTMETWRDVYIWAVSHGYSFNNEGYGKAADHPVDGINWYDCTKWCNARSEKEGLAPCQCAARLGGRSCYRMDMGGISDGEVGASVRQ